MINLNGDSICGRCVKVSADSTLIRNKVYEVLAAGILFPCCNKKQGCTKILGINDVETHEEKCLFIKFSCPVNDSGSLVMIEDCDWSGPYSKLLPHCSEKHLDSIRSNPIVINIKSFEIMDVQSYVVPSNGYIFSVKLKYDANEGKLWHAVRLIGHPKLVFLFNYIFISENSEGNILKTCTVLPFEERSPISEHFNETNVKSVTSILGSLETINFNLNISMNFHRCSKCRETLTCFPIFIKDDEFYCNQCCEDEQPKTVSDATTTKSVTPIPITTTKSVTPIPITTTKKPQTLLCTFKNSGCKFQTKNKSFLLKHLRWCCQFSDSQCKLGCGTKLHKISRVDHYVSSHVNFPSNKLYEVDKKYIGVIIVNKVNLLCVWEIQSKTKVFTIRGVSMDDSGKAFGDFQIYFWTIESRENFKKPIKHLQWKDGTSNWDFEITISYKEATILYKFEHFV